MTARVLLGLDVSLTACAAVACPIDWAGDWGRLRSVVAGRHLPKAAGDLAHVHRLESIAARVLAFAAKTHATEAWIESYAYGMGSCAHSLGEAGGVLRLELHRAGLRLHTAPISSARKLLLGHLPRQHVKEAVRAALSARGCPLATLDECDAFAALNWGLSQLRAHTLTASPVDPPGVVFS
jgi:hypothetical protein